MRFMIIVKATAESEAGIFPEDDTLMAEMAGYHEALQQAGVLLDGSGLRPSAQGWRIHYGTDGSRQVVEGPFAETKELIAGYTLIQVRSTEEAMEWARRFPAPMGAGVEAVIEVRPLYEMEDFPQTESIERMRRIDQVTK
ncbi:MAG: YciI family protein [Rhizobiales bacterium]|nr:YciI family protein [Rhizobacter sp.]